jgi:hypothetical protein
MRHIPPMALLQNRNPYVEAVKKAQRTILDGYATGHALSTREIVANALPLANVGISMEEIEHAVAFLRGSSAIAFGEEKHLEPLGPSRLPMAKRIALAREREQYIARLYWREVGDYSAWFRDALSTLVADRESARRSLRKDLDASLDEIIVVPRLLWDGNEAKLDLFYFWNSIVGLFGYVLMCLLDESMGLGEALRVCKYDECDRMFLSFPPAGGGPRPSYCSPEHRVAALREGGAKRVAKYRKELARKAK